MPKITYYGSEKEIAKAAAILKKRRSLSRMNEAKARLIIQQLIDQHSLKATIHVNNNAVWSRKRILKNLRRVKKQGTLYNPDQDKPPILSHYFYQFLNLCCGSIAHYDIHGWIHKYPTVEHLKQFFLKNEMGKRVIDYIPEWKTDARAIVRDIEIVLYPFLSYMKNREAS